MAVASYKAALKCVDPTSDAFLAGNIEFRLGWALIRSKKASEGASHLEAALEFIPENTEIMVKLAGILFKELHRSKDAITHLERAVLIQAENEEALFLLGKILDKEGRHKEGAEMLEQAAKLMVSKNTVKAAVFYFLGVAYENQKEYKKCA